ncbi:MAG: OmpA family protein [Bacteroidales bacterium]|nr:OmpA family protein [Bacteroidales bacterium]MBN2819184.1 OmpA family protein [Bacteroidales bacterium]
MRLYKLISGVSLLLLFTVAVDAQSKKFEKAYNTFNAGEYFEAIPLFKDAYDGTTDKNEKTRIIYTIAECYRKTNQPSKAALWYSKAIKKNYSDPLIYLHYADMLKMLGDYEEAKIQYQAYKELLPGDSRADDGILSCDQSMEWLEFPNGYTVEEASFFNSRSDDFNPAFAREDYRVIYFTSAREETTGKNEHGVSGQGFTDIFETTLDRKGKWSTPVPLSEEINTEYDDGTPVLTRDYKTMYFSRCAVHDNKSTGCEILTSIRKNDEWQKAKSLEIAEDSVLITHPAISADELTLYFVSDMPGSMAGADGVPSKDIWKVSRSSLSDDFGKPENLGDAINTVDDEAFPYIHVDGTLYFSSNGHVGMGGYDIYKAVKDESGNWTIENMRYPINSSSDDFGICFEAEREAGFLSSSRTGRSDDIYAFLLPPLRFSITGVVKNEKTDDPLVEASVKSIGSDGTTLETLTDDNGSFKFMLKPGTDYIFLAKKEGFLQGKERETTKSVESSTDFTSVIYLPPIDEPITVENIFFNFASAELRPESIVSLDKLVETLNDNPNITIELSSHTDARGNDDFNMTLSQNRAQSVVDYLISKDIKADRLVAKGYGESQPKTVDLRDHESYPFLPEGQLLTEDYINTITDEDLQEVAHFLNRRTEFKVLTTDYNQ